MFVTSMVIAAAVMQSSKKPPSKNSASAPRVRLMMIAAGSGPPSAVGDLVTVDYTGRLANNTIFDSSIPIKGDIKQMGHPPLAFPVGMGIVIPGWDQNLVGKKVGAQFKLTIPPSLAYGKGGTSDGTIPPNSTLIFDVHVLGIIKKGSKQVIEIHEITPGSGPVVKEKDNVTIHYTGTFLNGQKFDSSRDRNEPMSFQVGVGKVIPGFDLGLLGMKKGGRRKITIPPDLGYGDRAQGPIPPSSTLVFDIEVLDIK
jgi:peptidylprolyl isomerase